MFYWIDPSDSSASGFDDKPLCPRCKEDGKVVELVEKVSEYAGVIKKCPKCGWC